jgi:DNA-binding transcriptional LysR family regulator
MDKLHLIKIFVAIVDTNGFAGAARKLGLSPPAVTRAINDLEAQLGVRLLMRSTRIVRVTEAGARYAEDCRRILHDLAEADESVIGTHAAPRGKLNLTAPVLFGGIHLTPIVTDYLTRYPETKVSCLFVDRVVNMMEEGIDIALRIGALPDSSLQAIRVGQVRRVICAAPSYLARYGTPTSADDLQAHAIISSAGVAASPEWRVEENGKPRTIKLEPRMQTSTNDSALAAAVSGFGITRLMSYQIAQQLQEGTLQIILPELEQAPLPVHLVHHEGRQGSQRVRAFLDLAIEALRSNPALR